MIPSQGTYKNQPMNAKTSGTNQYLSLSLKNQFKKHHMRKGMIRIVSPTKRRTHLWEEQRRTTGQPESDSLGSVPHPWLHQLGVGGQAAQSLMT